MEKNRDEKSRDEKNEKRVMKKPMEIISLKDDACDPNGSYTGICEQPDETPVQDADDL